MRYAVLSDLHANLEALTVVFEKIRTLGNIDQILCCGDIVDYGVEPNECCELLLDHGVVSILGNHDRASLNLSEAESFNSMAKRSAYWTHKVLKQQYKNWFRTLHDQKRIGKNILLVHGAVSHRDDYLFEETLIRHNFHVLASQYPEVSLCFYGHSHIKQVWKNPGQLIWMGAESDSISFSIPLEATATYFINPGGLGQPRDRDPRTSFLVYDEEKKEITYYRLNYDIASTQKKILDAGLDSFLAERLALGI